MGIFESFRDYGWNTFYDTQRHTASVDVTHVIIGYFTVVIATALLILVISSRGKERWGSLLRLVFNLHTVSAILFCITGKEWAVGQVRSRCEYAATTNAHLQGRLGLHVGLKSINITLTADNHTWPLGDIYFNEEFSYRGSTDMETGMHRALHRGMPYAILYVVEYFGEDAGGLRWNRVLRAAGHFVYILLWTAFVAWIISQILFSFVITRAAICNAISGIFMIVACVLYHLLQSSTPLIIPFPDGFLRLRYGWSFWLCLGSGVATCMYSAVIMVLHHWLPSVTSSILLSGASEEDEEEYTELKTPGPLQIMTPYLAHKVRNQGAFTNPAYDDKDDDHQERYVGTHRNSQASIEDRSAHDYPESLHGLPFLRDNLRRSESSWERHSWDVPPDYSSGSEDEVEIPVRVDNSSPPPLPESEPPDARTKSAPPARSSPEPLCTVTRASSISYHDVPSAGTNPSPDSQPGTEDVVPRSLSPGSVTEITSPPRLYSATAIGESETIPSDFIESSPSIEVLNTSTSTYTAIPIPPPLPASTHTTIPIPPPLPTTWTDPPSSACSPPDGAYRVGSSEAALHSTVVTIVNESDNSSSQS